MAVVVALCACTELREPGQLDSSVSDMQSSGAGGSGGDDGGSGEGAMGGEGGVSGIGSGGTGGDSGEGGVSGASSGGTGGGGTGGGGEGGGGESGEGGEGGTMATCTPADEICNGEDEDCDDVADNGASCDGGQHCVAGECRACGEGAHCTDAAPSCQEYFCNTESYACELRALPAAPTATCTGSFGAGVCDGASCVQCLDDGDCEADPDRNECENNVCRPCEGAGCARGAECTYDDDCASGDCDELTSVCAETCSGSFTLTTTADLNSLRGCRSISGALTISEDTALGLVKLPLLESVGSLSAQCMNRPGLTSLSLPALESVDTDLILNACPGLLAIDMPALTTVGDAVQVASHINLADANFSAIVAIGGQLSVGFVKKLPFPDTRPLWQAAALANQAATEIGCDVAGDTNCAACASRTCTPMF